ncbi:hypothetical protein [Cryobacterium sp. Y62]|uniref:hypothetical protein n=1 Tax=Cryobacterium sp. Y62 TaxID=2048284 RepID=UPI000CE3566A|nr:hypothetical protein [Cryobacterium sp. Y62]
MARIQILELPSTEISPGVYNSPFSIIIDHLDSEEMCTSTGVVFRTVTSGPTQAQADQIARDMGAVSAILSAGTLDLA